MKGKWKEGVVGTAIESIVQKRLLLSEEATNQQKGKCDQSLDIKFIVLKSIAEEQVLVQGQF